MNPLLRVEHLTIEIPEHDQIKPLVSNVCFDISPGKTFVLVGESGSGKSITALSILRLLPPFALPTRESCIQFEGKDLLSLSEVDMRYYRGKEISIVFQEPMTSFNPVLTIGEQIGESLKLHKRLKGRFLYLEIVRLLKLVQIKDPERILLSYPHQLSGGMKQRAMIAMALAGDPKLLIADEPTTALDVTTQAEILTLLKKLQAELGLAILFITHDLQVAARIGDSLGVMHKGSIVEQGNVSEILQNPSHEYTQHLVSAVPTLHIEPIVDECETVLAVEHLKIYFPIQKGLFKRTVGWIKAVDDVSLELRKGETLALVGESGCGKSTLAKGIMSLIQPSSGEVIVLGDCLKTLNQKQLKNKRSEFQIIFQDPFSSLNPRWLVKDIIEEGMLALNIGTDKAERSERIDILLNQVGLRSEHQFRYPHQFSGGQRQRICIARALAVGPKLLVCDEPTSSLDVSVQAQILDLLIGLQNELGLSYLFITHNFKVVQTLAHQVAVMQNGRIVESGSIEKVLKSPSHAYTKTLLNAV